MESSFRLIIYLEVQYIIFFIPFIHFFIFYGLEVQCTKLLCSKNHPIDTFGNKKLVKVDSKMIKRAETYLQPH